MERGKWNRIIWIGAPVILALAVVGIRSQDCMELWRVLFTQQPVLEMTSQLNLGKREHGQIVVARFLVANRGNGKLVLDEIRTSCACTGLERELDGQDLRVETLELWPGERAELRLRIGVRGRIGRAEHDSVYFRTNDPRHPEATFIAVIEEVTGGVWTSPANVNWGTVSLGAASSQQLEVYDSSSKPKTIKRVESTNPDAIAVRWVPAASSMRLALNANRATSLGRIELTANTKRPRSLSCRIKISLDDETRVPDLIDVTGRVAAIVEAVPAQLVLPRASSSGPLFFATCLCKSTLGKRLALTFDEGSPGIRASITPLANNPSSAMVRIDWNPAATSENNLGKPAFARFRAKAGEQEINLEIPLRLVARPPDP
jgi:hypothetical protein